MMEQKLIIRNIQIEELEREVVLEGLVAEYGNVTPTKFLLSMMDFNRVLLRLGALGHELSISEDFDCYDTSQGRIYIFDNHKDSLPMIAIDFLTECQDIKQIRA